jgi:hypothetical protein
MMDYDMREDTAIAKKVKIEEYLAWKGIKVKPIGKHHWCSSPFTSDTSWSFCIYKENNTFYDWSTGMYGDVIDLAQNMEGKGFKDTVELLLDNSKDWLPFVPSMKTVPPKDFKLHPYITSNKREMKEIRAYAKERKILTDYTFGVVQKKVSASKNFEEYYRVPGILFIHKDQYMNIIGFKMRVLPAYCVQLDYPRFAARGRLGWYILYNKYYTHEKSDKPITLYIIESETSANSLKAVAMERDKPCVILSAGSVTSCPPLPSVFDKVEDKKVIIDYDGNEELFNLRKEGYEKYGAEIVKLELPKDEDINSLYVKDKLGMYHSKLGL